MIVLCPNLCYNAVCYKGDCTVYRHYFITILSESLLLAYAIITKILCTIYFQIISDIFK